VYGGPDGSELLASASTNIIIVNHQPASGLTLQILKPDGTPAAGAPVRVYHYVPEWEEYEEVVTGDIRADVSGKIQVPGSMA